MSTSPRIVVVITEGASPELLREFVAKGWLPGFAQLTREGASGELDSHAIPYEPPALLTAFSGADPSEHGWFSYWSVHEPDHKPRGLTTADLRVSPFWSRPQYRQKHLSLINIFGTHPPQPISGEVITYPMSQTLRACYPRDLLANLQREGLPYSHDVSVWFKGRARSEFVPQVLEADHRRAAVALRMYQQGADVTVVNLTGIDRLSHIYWQELEPGSPVPREHSAVLNAYRCCDELLQSLFRCMDNSTTLLAFSEIGFGPLRQYVCVNRILADAGLLSWAEEGVEVDWSGTVAAESVQGSSGVNLNLEGRYVDGKVSRRDYERVQADVAAVLTAATNPYTGLKLFEAVSPRDVIYQGPAEELAPDLILFPYDLRYLPLGDLTWSLHVKRFLQSGWHRSRSYWAALGPGVPATATSQIASLQQILPTIEAALGFEPSTAHSPIYEQRTTEAALA